MSMKMIIYMNLTVPPITHLKQSHLETWIVREQNKLVCFSSIYISSVNQHIQKKTSFDSKRDYTFQQNINKTS